MGTKEAYQDKMEARLRAWKAKIDELRAKADKAGADARTKYHEQIRALRTKQGVAEKKLQDLRGAGEESWEDLKMGVDKAWGDLKKAVEDAVSRFKGLKGPTAMGDPSATGREEEIRTIAYHLWEQESRPQGRDLEHWRRAEVIWRERQDQEQLQREMEPPKRVRRKKEAQTKPAVRRVRYEKAASKSEEK